MSIYSDTNPPAFPRSYGHDGHNGMTLRDWFAGQVLAAIARSDVSTVGSRAGVATWAYAQADAMLAARAEHGK